ncbi:MAG: hypothetical protein ACHQ1H_10470 [Nitrososphaerales archaeon]
MQITENKSRDTQDDRGNGKQSKKKKRKETVSIRATSPASAACEIPILSTLSRNPEEGVRAKTVVEEVASALWFPKLTEDDRRARYVRSHKKIVSTIIRWSRENLVLRGEVYAPGSECTEGFWRATPKGTVARKRARRRVDCEIRGTCRCHNYRGRT